MNQHTCPPAAAGPNLQLRQSLKTPLWLGWIAALTLAGCCVWLISSGSFEAGGLRGFTLFDDAMISMRYAQNLADHGRWSWSEASGLTEGYTNFGWMLIMAAAYRVGGLFIAPLLVSLIAIAFLIAGAVGLHRSQTKYRSLGWPLILCALTGSFSLVFWSARGFEVALIFLLQACLYTRLLSTKSRLSEWSIAPIVFAGVFTRDDFAVTTTMFLLLMLPISFLGKSEIKASRQVKLVVSLVAAILAKTAVRLVIFGTILPNTYHLKVEGHDKSVMLLRGFVALLIDSTSFLLPILLLLLLLYGASPHKFRHALTSKPQELSSHLLVGSCIIYSIFVGGDAWEWSGLANRFVAPILPFMLLNLLLFIQRLTVLSPSSWPSRKEGQRAALTIAIALPALMALNRFILPIAIGKFSNVIDGLRVAEDSLLKLFWISSLLLLLLLPAGLRRMNMTSMTTLTLPTLAGLYLSLVPTILISHSVLANNGNLLHLHDDRNQAIQAIASQRFIPDGSSVVAKWAGTFPYYRPKVNFIDPWGKMDQHIAHMKPKWRFYPGHTKWDYTYTLSRYKPDFIIGNLANDNRNAMLRDKTVEYRHYQQLTPEIMIRRSPQP